MSGVIEIPRRGPGRPPVPVSGGTTNNRHTALALAIQSMGPQGNNGAEQMILHRAREFAKFLDGDPGNQPPG